MAPTNLRKIEPRDYAPLLTATAVFAFLWIIARAALQSITIDEADTYLGFVAPADPTYWVAASNNHLLNSLLMRLSTTLFGLSHLSVRAPALLGALIYITAAHFLCRRLTSRMFLRWSVFVCLVFTPFVADYLVAARGYSLALGFLLAALAMAAGDARDGWRRPVRTCAVVSLFAALSFAANFAFALADGALVLFVLWWALREAPSASLRVRIAAASFLPGLLAGLFLTGSILASSSKGQFVYGATSLYETAKSVWQDLIFQVNPFVVNPPLREALTKWSWLVPALLLAAGLWRTAVVYAGRRTHADERSRWLRRLAQIAAGALAVAMGVHWILFRAIHLPLPKDRTALYVVPLGILVLGALASSPSVSRMESLSARAATASFVLAAAFFLCCLRLTYFKEWRYDADVETAYFTAAYYNRTYGVRTVPTSWKYFAALNFYRVLSGREKTLSFEAGVIDAHTYRTDCQVYMLESGFDDAFANEQKLKVLYRNDESGMMVAIRPSLEQNPAQ